MVFCGNHWDCSCLGSHKSSPVASQTPVEFPPEIRTTSAERVSTQQLGCAHAKPLVWAASPKGFRMCSWHRRPEVKAGETMLWSEKLGYMGHVDIQIAPFFCRFSDSIPGLHLPAVQLQKKPGSSLSSDDHLKAMDIDTPRLCKA